MYCFRRRVAGLAVCLRRLAFVPSFLLFLLYGLAAETPAALALKTFDVCRFGAKGNGKTLDTAAIQTALDECGKAGGGIVQFSRGTYLSKPIFLRSKTTLRLDRGATLLATDEPDDFLIPERKSEPRSSGSFFAFVNGKDLTNVTIAGGGTIDGAGARWWVPAEEARRKTPGYTLPRPRLIVLTRCKNVRVEGLTLANSPSFHLVPTDCEDVSRPAKANQDSIPCKCTKRNSSSSVVESIGFG